MRRLPIHPYALLLRGIVLAPVGVAVWWFVLATAPCEIIERGTAVAIDGRRTARVVTQVCSAGPIMSSVVDKVEVHHGDGSDEVVFEAEATHDTLEVAWAEEQSLALYRVTPTGKRTLLQFVAVPF